MAREHALQMPGAVAEWPFGPESEVFKVRGKIFLFLTRIPAGTTALPELAGQSVLVLKVDPEDPIREHPGIWPGYHMNKRHWITVTSDVDKRLVEELITDSFRKVGSHFRRRR